MSLLSFCIVILLVQSSPNFQTFFSLSPFLVSFSSSSSSFSSLQLRVDRSFATDFHTAIFSSLLLFPILVTKEGDKWW